MIKLPQFGFPDFFQNHTLVYLFGSFSYVHYWQPWLRQYETFRTVDVWKWLSEPNLYFLYEFVETLNQDGWLVKYICDLFTRLSFKNCLFIVLCSLHFCHRHSLYFLKLKLNYHISKGYFLFESFLAVKVWPRVFRAHSDGPRKSILKNIKSPI